jgi:hypothetical protein
VHQEEGVVEVKAGEGAGACPGLCMREPRGELGLWGVEARVCRLA